MSRLAGQTNLASAAQQKLQGHLSATDLALMRSKERMSALRMETVAFGTAMSAAFAGVGIGLSVYGVKQAADFQTAMTGVNLAATGGKNPTTQRQRAAMEAQAVSLSGTLAQSAVTIANEMSVAAQTAFKDPAQLMFMMPQLAKYADVRYQLSGKTEDPVNTVALSTQAAHLYQAYTPDKMRAMLDQMARLQLTAHVGLQQLVTQSRLFAPTAMSAGMNLQDLFQWIAISAQNGLMQNRGGAGINNIILTMEKLIPSLRKTGALPPDVMDAFARMHIKTGSTSNAMDITSHARIAVKTLELLDTKGNFKFLGSHGEPLGKAMIDWLTKIHAQMVKADPVHGQGRFNTALVNLFGKEADRPLSIFTNPVARQQMDANKLAFARLPDIQQQWEAFFGDKNGNGGKLTATFSAFVTNLQNLAMVIALPELPMLTKLFAQWSAQLSTLVNYLKANPTVAKKVADTIALVTASFIALTGVGLTMMALAPAAAALRIIGSLGLIQSAITTFGVIMGGSAVAGVPAALMTLRLSIMGIAGPAMARAVAAFGRSMPGLVAAPAILLGLGRSLLAFAATTVTASVAAIPATLLAIRGAIIALASTSGLMAIIDSFVVIAGGASVAGAGLALSTLGTGLLAILSPLALAGAAVVAFYALTTKAAGSDEGSIRSGDGASTYGTDAFWQKWIRDRGGNTSGVPSDVLKNLHDLHTVQQSHMTGTYGSISRTMAKIWLRNGGDPSVAGRMGAIAANESGGDAGIVNSIGAAGLWQIYSHGKGNWLNPDSNAREAIALYKGRKARGQSGFEDWEDSRTKGGYGGWEGSPLTINVDARGHTDPGAIKQLHAAAVAAAMKKMALIKNHPSQSGAAHAAAH